MRIGIDATFIGTEKPTGLAVYTRNIVNQLFKLHDDIVLWAADDRGFDVPSDRIRPVLKEFALLGERRFMIRPLWMELFFPRKLIQERVDVLFSTVPGGMMHCPVPHVVTVHDLTPITFPEDHPRSVRWNFLHRLPKILYNAAAVIAVSHHTRHDILTHYKLDPASIHVIGEGYDPDNFRPAVSCDMLHRHGLKPNRYIIAVGSANRRKNLHNLIVSLGGISERIPHNLVFAGPLSDKDISLLRRQAAECGVADRLVFTGHVSNQELSVLYTHASVFAYLSLYEGFGLPILEAMACGAPVLASNTTSIPEVAGDAALLVDPQRPELISEALLEVVSESALRDKLVKAGLERVKRFSWQQSAEEILSVLQQHTVKSNFHHE